MKEACLGGRANDGGAQQLQRVHLFVGVLLGHHDDAGVSAHGTSECHTDSSVTRGSLDDREALADETLLLGIQHHAIANAILDRTARVQEFTFRVYY